MADEFQAEVCGGSWWNSSRSLFGSSPCSSGTIHDLGGGFGLWANELLDIKARCSDESGSASDGSSIVIQDHMHKPNQTDSAIDSSLQVMGLGLSSSTDQWNRANFLHGTNGRCEANYPPNPMLQEDHNSRMNYGPETHGQQMQKDWPRNLKKKSFSATFEDSCMSSSTQEPCTATTFPISSVSYGYSSTLLQPLIDTPDHHPQPQHSSLYGNRPNLIHYASAAATNYQTNLNEFSSPCNLPKYSPLNLSNNAANFCNASAAALNDFRATTTFPPHSQLLPSTFNHETCLPGLTAKCHKEQVKGLSSVAKKTSSEQPTLKRPRIETPSPLPTFKVRKEKLGDRITALQQLVSPFGKTDTASVLHEAIEYIKFLHDQVSVLSTPYLRNGSHIHRQPQTCDKANNQEGPEQDLKGRGLCLVPISSTFPVAAETTNDFWTPTFGATFR